MQPRNRGNANENCRKEIEMKAKVRLIVDFSELRKGRTDSSFTVFHSRLLKDYIPRNRKERGQLSGGDITSFGVVFVSEFSGTRAFGH